MKNNSLTIAGFMSGTSMDGLDCCIAKVGISENWDFNYEIIATKSFDFNFNVRDKICKNLGETQISNIVPLDDFMGKTFLNLSKDFLLSHKFDAISIHGQTIHHRDKVKTIQVGNPCYLASFFKVPVIYNFRQKDIDAGGNGAPLMPFLDWLLFKKCDTNTVAINLGGISNISFIKKKSIKSDVLGFDTGPGMSLIDEYVFKIWSEKCDFNGKYSADSQIEESLLNHLVDNSSFISAPPPKSTTREDFGASFIDEFLKYFNHLNENNILRTLVKFTSLSLKLNIDRFIKDKYEIDNVIITGGGANHPFLMSDIKKDLDIPQVNIIDYGIESKFKESFLMSVLGYAKIKGIESNMPSVTGSNKSIVLGEIYCD